MLYAKLVMSAFAVLVWCETALAEVRALDASVESRVLQTFSDGTVNSDRSFDALDQSTPNLPMHVRAHLEHADARTLTLSSATSACTFSDPRSSPEDNPREIAMHSVMFSFDSGTTYGGTSVADETRTIAFTESDIGASEGTDLLVTSHLFLDGYLALWGDLNLSANPSSALVYVRIEQLRPLNASPTVVLEATLALTHDNVGNPILTADGAVVVDNVLPPDDTLDSVFPLGLTYLVAIPQLSIPYEYEAKVGEEFTLKVQVQCRVANQPFTGAGVCIGGPLEDFVGLILDTMRAPPTAALAPAMARSEARIPAKPLSAGKGTQVEIVGRSGLWQGFGLSACGGLGFEAMFLTAGFPAMMWAVRRRR